MREVVCYLCSRHLLLQKEEDVITFLARPICPKCRFEHTLGNEEETSGITHETLKRRQVDDDTPREERITEKVKTLEQQFKDLAGEFEASWQTPIYLDEPDTTVDNTANNGTLIK